MNTFPLSVPKRMPLLQRLCITCLLVWCAACSTIQAPRAPEAGAASSSALASCAQWLDELDATIDRAHVGDAGAQRIPGFPYLRVDRFTASFRDQAGSSSKAFAAWTARLKALDAQARAYEIGNLPAQSIPLAGFGDQTAVHLRTQFCAESLAAADLSNPARRELLVARAQVPDNYAAWKRALGGYPIVSIAFSAGVESWQKEATEMFRRAGAESTPAAGSVRYESAFPPVARDQITTLFRHPHLDALGIPQFTEAERDLLFRAYAPAFEIETTGAYDRFGSLSWRDGPSPDVDPARPVAYRRLAFTRFYGKILTQLVYAVWFPERPPRGPADLLAGKLDGVVFRVTLGTDGTPLIYDTMHPCGCYHLFFPTARVHLLPAPEPAIEWAFAPITVPTLAAAERVVVRVQSRTHYVVDVRADRNATGIAYQFADDNALRALPAAGQQTRSAFGPDGIVPGTERGERLFFWPMGIDNSGAMRQWGNHATAFIGHRHFDDADLLERRFAVSPRAAGLLNTTQ